MRALITGITGFVGSHLADFLLAETDWHVTGFCRWQDNLENIEALIPEINQGGRVSLVYGDLRDEISIRAAIKTANPDYVFHLAAQSYPLTSVTAPLDTIETNTLGTIRLLDALKRRSRTIVHICSSSEVYGKVPKRFLPIKEDCPFQPASPYAISKVGADLAGQYYASAYGMNVYVTRMFTHTGPRRGDVFAESTFAKQIAMIEHGQIVPVIRVGNLESTRTIADVGDAVRAYYMLVMADPHPRHGRVFNIGGGHTCTVRDILDTLIGMSSLKPKVELDPARRRPVDADFQVPDCSLFKQATGWEPRIPFEQTMHDLLQFWRARVERGPCLIR
jgi:GDPmannose 4,6-dehydratase